MEMEKFIEAQDTLEKIKSLKSLKDNLIRAVSIDIYTYNTSCTKKHKVKSFEYDSIIAGLNESIREFEKNFEEL